MAREEKRWCYFDGANGRGRPTWIPLLLVVLCALLAGSLAAAEHDHSYYSYAGWNGKSSFDHLFSNIRLIDGEDVARVRRAAPDKSVVATEQKAELLKDQPLTQPQPQQQQQQQQPPQPHQEPQQQPQQQSQPQQPQLQQPQKQQQQPQKQQQQPASPTQPATSNTTNASTDVTYSAAYSTSDATSTTVRPSGSVSSPKPDFKKKASQAANPATDTTLHIWANRTLSIRNITDTGEVKQSEPPAAKNAAEDAMKIDDIDDISISKFSDVTNTTLMQNNITKMVNDTHQYYNSTFIINDGICKKYWVDLDNHPDLRVNHLLSQSHRRAATVKLTFDFPFYGYNVRNITIATGGFLYTGDYVHSWLAATQYIAPLMANFDTRLSNTSYVKYADNGTAFTVEWEKVVLQDKPADGEFTFQVTLHQNGDIVFVYSVIPLPLKEIEDTMHPVKVGLSDAYIMDRTVFFVRRKTIYEYHRVHFDRQDIKNCTVISLKALPTCLNFDNCRDCLTKVQPDFDCKWCPDLNKCSTGTSRQKQEWLQKGCDKRNIKDADNCPAQITTYRGPYQYDHDGHVHPEESIASNEMGIKQERSGSSSLESPASNKVNMSVSGIIGILTVVAFVVGLAGWGVYAYRNPHSPSGQMLIRYRPSQWSWRRGEARYTAATIHM
ncbi:PREDICTED: plexin domain-containing protein 2 [Vollenhovia emeryi]|uniref:plexin domain-containing protein 2 n=1 Tax=Vollenhovia emeryi TaxID=411798 RepID=UPI0005F3E743|nr:PREDICTED: plexin domain-containing protein 2 [Vollenhovia emeryi]